VRLIVDLISPHRYRWPFESRALVIDDEEMFREVIVAQLEIAGCVCHAASNYLEALRLLEADPGIKAVIFDYEMPDRFVPSLDIPSMIARMKKIREDLIIIGNSGGDHREDFRKAGTDLFLFKPWRIDEFIETVKKEATRRQVEL
jgi:CheY-like chemotaxis protein